MEDQLTEFENPPREPVKTRRIFRLYALLLLLLLAALGRTWLLWKRITHH